MMNSFNLTLSGKHFICPSILTLISLHVISISVILFLFQLFAQFFLFLGSVTNICEFVVILLFILLIFFFLNNPFNISYNNGVVIMSSFRFFLSGKLFICHSILNDSFAGQSNIGCIHDFEYFLPIPSSRQSFF